MTKVNMFADKDTELVKESSKKAEAEMAEESSSKRAGEELKKEPTKKQKIHRKGRQCYYEIMRADGSAKTYLLFSQLLKEFDREDLENLWKLVKAKHRNTRPEEGYERVLWGDLKTITLYKFSSWVWDNLKPLLCIPNVPSALDDIVAFLIPVAKMKSIRSVVCKLVFSAACYFLWQERNYRIFKKKKRSKDKILELIKSNVRLKLLTCSFKKTPNVQMLAHIWKLPCSLVRPSPTLV
ncbi:hypothetical protein Tco_1056181 [Tanacetum coccineum]|uniref:Reverse transcriptase zinc-binding domain-containing protein n=1 Tax=Tanacetum coccineum TaxID=301880 RepID=A0ABQ5H304_9ASTR